MLVALVLAVLMSDSDSEGDMPDECISRPPPASTEVHSYQRSDDIVADLGATPRQRAQSGSMRGRYDRSTGKGAKMPWTPYVQQHMQAISTGNLSMFLTNIHYACSKNCPQGGKCLEAVGSIRTLKVCAGESFGDAALSQNWDQLRPKHNAIVGWFQRAHAGRLLDASGNVSEIRYQVGDQLVCGPAWAAMRGVPPATAASIDRAVRRGEMTWNDGTGRAAANSTRTLEGSRRGAATTWWMTRLTYYEMITARGLILHPREVEWKTVYADEFVPEMRLLGHPWKDPDAEDHEDHEYGSQATWYAGRSEALQLLAQEKLGADSKPFTFKSRAKHSAYKECHDCHCSGLYVRIASVLGRWRGRRGGRGGGAMRKEAAQEWFVSVRDTSNHDFLSPFIIFHDILCFSLSVMFFG